LNKKIIFLFLILNFSFVLAQEGIKAGVRYTEASARIEAFKDIKQKIEKDIYKKYLKDENCKENKLLISNKIFEVENQRFLYPFYYKNNLIAYSIVYFDNIEYTFYYNLFGSLIKFDVKNITSEEYPKKIYGYSRFGNLISVSFEVNENEQFVYDENGKLTAHWLDNNMSSKDNKIPKFLKITRGEKD